MNHPIIKMAMRLRGNICVINFETVISEHLLRHFILHFSLQTI